jgi:hypothetical protein
MADKFVFSNFAVTTLAASVGVDDTSIQINVDDVYRFPTLTGGSKFPIVLADSDDLLEIMYVTALDVAGVATVERGREGTQPQSWLAGTMVQHTWTAATIIGAGGIRPKGTWSSTVAYDPGDLVVHTSISWIAVNTSLNSAPSLVSPDWQVLYQPPGAASTAMNWAGRWATTTTYAAGQVVEYKGVVWQAAGASLNSPPAVGNANWIGVAEWYGATRWERVINFTGTNNYTATLDASEAPAALYDGLSSLPLSPTLAPPPPSRWLWEDFRPRRLSTGLD